MGSTLKKSLLQQNRSCFCVRSLPVKMAEEKPMLDVQEQPLRPPCRCCSLARPEQRPGRKGSRPSQPDGEVRGIAACGEALWGSGPSS